MSEPVMVDLRTIVGTPRGDYPIKVRCPLHNDPGASLAVYEGYCYCYGACRRRFRRYESAALLLGLWDGRPETVEEAVKVVRPMLGSLHLVQRTNTVKQPIKPIDKSLADTFHRFLLSQPETMGYFMAWRGLREGVIDELKLGFTGSHFSIPVFGRGGELLGVRYRVDPRTDTDGPKYSGITDYNTSKLYSMRLLCDVEDSGTAWVFEGELDLAIGRQLGLPSVTMTNGAGRLDQLPELVRAAGLNPSRWVLATDQDEAGEQAAWELKKQLGSLAVRAKWDSSYKDISAFHVAGGGIQDIRLTGQQKGATMFL